MYWFIIGLLFAYVFVMHPTLSGPSAHMRRNIHLYVKRLVVESIVPEFKSAGAAGFDVYACCPPTKEKEKEKEKDGDTTIQESSITIQPGDVARIPTGCAYEIPRGHEVQIRSRSGLTIHDHVVVANAPGTIDSDYRGEVCVLLANYGKEPFEVKHGMRIAQGVLARVTVPVVSVVHELRPSTRGSNGFGSSGLF